jgi:hypothetical protein
VRNLSSYHLSRCRSLFRGIAKQDSRLGGLGGPPDVVLGGVLSGCIINGEQRNGFSSSSRRRLNGGMVSRRYREAQDRSS